MRRDRRYAYLKETFFKSFTSYKRMKEFAQTPENDGTYYVSSPSITIKMTQEEVRNTKCM